MVTIHKRLKQMDRQRALHYAHEVLRTWSCIAIKELQQSCRSVFFGRRPALLNVWLHLPSDDYQQMFLFQQHCIRPLRPSLQTADWAHLLASPRNAWLFSRETKDQFAIASPAMDRSVESHSGDRGKHFLGDPLGRNFWFFFENGTFWHTLYFWPTAGPGVANPPTPPSRRAWLWVAYAYVLFLLFSKSLTF